MKTADYAREIRDCLDVDRYATLIHSLGSLLNDRKDRFDKSDIIEQSMEVYTQGKLIWVDRVGRDHRDRDHGFDLEFKYGENSLYTGKKRQRDLVKVKIKNSLGKNKGTTIDDPADFYIIAQQDAMALISWEELRPYLVGVADGIEAHIPQTALTMIFRPEDCQAQDRSITDYKQIKARAQRQLIESI